MRAVFTLSGPQGRLTVPRQYNEILQGLLYRNLDEALAEHLHDQGVPSAEGGRRLRMFTFSRLMGKWEPAGDRITFLGPVRWVVASPIEPLLPSLAERLLRTETLRLGDTRAALEAIEVETPVEPQPPVQVEALSPITTYSTLYTAEGRRKTYYYSPFEAEFSSLLLKNLARKVRAWDGDEVPPEGSIRPVRVSPRDEHIVKYRGTVIRAWTGIYELDVSPALFEMAYHAGLGAKNSQGFGCLRLWRPAH